MNDESVEQAKSQHYPAKISFDEEDGVYVVEFFDLPGCSAYGDTVEEAYRRAEEAKKEWMRVSVEQGLPIPAPSKTNEYSGRLLVRLPSGLHATLADQAKLHGTSLNQYLVHLLSNAVAGEEVKAQLSDLARKVGQLEFRIAQLSTSAVPPQVQQRPSVQYLNPLSTATYVVNDIDIDIPVSKHWYQEYYTRLENMASGTVLSAGKRPSLQTGKQQGRRVRA